MRFVKSLLASAVVAAGFATAVSATTVTIFDGVAAGKTNFDNTVTAAGGTVKTDTWSGLSSSTSIDRGDYVITQNDGGIGYVTTYYTLSGEVMGIDPARDDGGYDYSGRTDPLDYFKSGITLTFASAVNSIGFEVGDWATCCHDPVTELFISFDDGTPIKVASADESSDGRFPSQANPANSVYEIFVAAFDDTGDFTKVSFWGNGLGEYLVFGGQVRYALLDQGSLPPDPNAVPLPAGGLLLVSALGAAGFLRRRKHA